MRICKHRQDQAFQFSPGESRFFCDRTEGRCIQAWRKGSIPTCPVYINQINTPPRICTVRNCTRPVKEGNRFFCEFHFIKAGEVWI